LHLLVHQVDDLFQHVKELRSGDGVDLFLQLTAPFDLRDEVLDAKRGQRPAGAL
jgi:hypothetical protein